METFKPLKRRPRFGTPENDPFYKGHWEERVLRHLGLDNPEGLLDYRFWGDKEKDEEAVYIATETGQPNYIYHHVLNKIKTMQELPKNSKRRKQLEEVEIPNLIEKIKEAKKNKEEEEKYD